MVAEPVGVRQQRVEPLGREPGSPAATRSQANASSGVWMLAVAVSPHGRAVAYSGARRQRGCACQNAVCGTNPSARPARSSVRSSARARAGSKRLQTIAWKHESQYHWCL